MNEFETVKARQEAENLSEKYYGELKTINQNIADTINKLGQLGQTQFIKRRELQASLDARNAELGSLTEIISQTFHPSSKNNTLLHELALQKDKELVQSLTATQPIPPIDRQ